ncbi:sodium:alanine symporter [Pontibacillus halophilus JSM 076056 = DSM 19796]|uniref:Sodium:alanine symporter n=1 Tax=Pontibacillus halophilus JSM 076056 = DSM 19796 TaxID=1385510 RepID=A0A0A5GKF3_9BACI|nr:sodium:alanine symporter family protein [Pontibacillus halophilus]KGX92459.1 sodium:alanine symporter [Pontibacillus halophilus JSM 076056 = DSM 19796]
MLVTVLPFIETVVANTSNFLWTYVLSILLICTGLYLTVQLRFFQFRFFGHILGQTVGKIFKKSSGHAGTITPFQAFTSALASTAGATNIVGVPVAISFGGPGALFWMWVVALIGMATKYTEIVLGVRYREKNKKGEWVGGPQYYIKKGLGWNKVAWAFAFILMLELIPSIMTQSNSISIQVNNSIGWSRLGIGVAIAVVVGAIIIGGIQRIARVTDKFVPFMVFTYVIICLIVIFAHVETLPSVFGLIFSHAFTPIAATGGFAGAALAQALRWGTARGLYSNEAGLGTAPIAHAAAQTDHPSKQGFWGVFSVFVDTIVICTLSGLTVLVTGAWKEVSSDDAASMIGTALSDVYGSQFGETFVSIFLLFFVLTTIGILVFFGEKQAEYLFGLKGAYFMRVIYLGAIVLGAVGGLQFIWQFLDLMLAAVVFLNVIPVLFLSKEVRAVTQDYVNRIYKQKKDTKKIDLFHESDKDFRS